MSVSKKTAKPSPPAAVVDSDAHWSATMAKLRARTLPERTVRICDDQGARSGYERARDEARRARQLADSSPGIAELGEAAAQAEEDLESARAEFHGRSVVLTFRALPRPVMEELISAHPPTEAQDGAAFNPVTFPAALISASSADGMSEDDARELLELWTAADANALWDAAWTVQQDGRIDLGKD
ncbi:hypothetical protein [Streptomyces luteireticuli]|uniref:hypothetical protein n=1 Tax=Streptomyces luteireticuli TaxID=173858 RepID=UPI003558BCB2